MLFGQEITIQKNEAPEAALDHAQLYAIGLTEIQRLSSRVWSDYNAHDPGKTTLELLCYALTDLGYRASFPMKDLLSSESENAEKMKQQFFTARQILPNRSLTLLDYRKLLIDLKGVKNAWLKPATVTYYADNIKKELLKDPLDRAGIVEVKLAGLYDVTLEYMDDVTTALAKEAVMKKAKKCLLANRNLCEDFVGFAAVDVALFILCSEIELASDADVEQIEAEIFFQLQEYLSPPVVNYTLKQMLEKTHPDGTAYTADEIFDGPALDCGFIDNDELEKAALRTEIRLSDIISIIMDIPGVQAVREIVINPKGTKTALQNKWVVAVESGKKASLMQTESRLAFYKRNMPIVSDDEKVKSHYNALMASATAKVETAFSYDFDIPLGKYRQPESYYSFQNHFPALYGISEAGLSSMESIARQANAYQLKGYLLFFDQIMANYFAQLSHIKELFSSNPDVERTYFYQVVDSFTNDEKIYGTPDPVDTIETSVEDKDILISRRNRFLDHLIARFAEQFNDYAQIMYAVFHTSQKEMIAYKCDFLNDYPAISSERALAYDYSLKADDDLWNSKNISGLEKRLAKLLGIRNDTRRNLGNIAYDVYAEIDKTPDDEFRFRIRDKNTGHIILSSSTKYTTPKLAQEEMRRAIHFGLLPSGYDRKVTAGGKYYFNVIDNTGEVIARRIQYFDTKAQMNEAIEAVMNYLEVNYSEEGMYLIENILLRPEEKTDPFLPICIDSNCTDCSEKDPYSYRIHIILPAESTRFSNIDFRRFAEGIIREEAPAHILPKICWISKEDMVAFEKLYRDWIYLKAGTETAQRHEKLTAFLKKLFEVKSIYPSQKLQACASTEDKFILGQTALGTQ